MRLGFIIMTLLQSVNQCNGPIKCLQSRKKPRLSLSKNKIMVTIFWDQDGLILMDMLEKKILPSTRKDIDNARSHTAQQTLAQISRYGWTLMPHPTYSPDLAPPDFYLFVPMMALTAFIVFCGVIFIGFFSTEYNRLKLELHTIASSILKPNITPCSTPLDDSLSSFTISQRPSCGAWMITP
ncbi:hypothetical protein LAZ67_2004145 [Cordylochernes scorpioides]|uniref:Transposase n=1 Tax=Cordylochernes scorpioides TaxID=51811 RepID=A0ABY6K3M0_9ARAC|nr:hypothetical protein LAZ67_2004145 [Cordylochernes scorpioides]